MKRVRSMTVFFFFFGRDEATTIKFLFVYYYYNLIYFLQSFLLLTVGIRSRCLVSIEHDRSGGKWEKRQR